MTGFFFIVNIFPLEKNPSISLQNWPVSGNNFIWIEDSSVYLPIDIKGKPKMKSTKFLSVTKQVQDPPDSAYLGD